MKQFSNINVQLISKLLHTTAGPRFTVWELEDYNTGAVS